MDATRPAQSPSKSWVPALCLLRRGLLVSTASDKALTGANLERWNLRRRGARHGRRRPRDQPDAATGQGHTATTITNREDRDAGPRN
jgi:hypothetical protein